MGHCFPLAAPQGICKEAKKAKEGFTNLSKPFSGSQGLFKEAKGA
jgi:hypothetical protein